MYYDNDYVKFHFTFSAWTHIRTYW